MPYFVTHAVLVLLASIPAVKVDPLFPPHPTIINPNLGIFKSVSI
jgi:hypothetical protein